MLNVRLSSGGVHVIVTGTSEEARGVHDEIVNREHEYEWIETSDGHAIRVEAIDEIWLDNEADAQAG